MDLQQEIAYEGRVMSEKLELVKVEADRIQRRMTKTAEDIKKGRKALRTIEESFTSNKLVADYLLFGSDELRLSWVQKILTRPYFCRIDWAEKEGPYSDMHSYYIGRIGMCNTDDYTPIIVDWRAPIANLYYDGRLGDAEYNALDGTVYGTLSLKRQLEIENTVIKSLTDIDITTTDTLLQAALSKSADDRLKDIVVTIQSEQNRIIRAESDGVLIVQGVAGSGKTTIVLHRVAYLVYHREGGKGMKTLIIAPNKLFLNYISNVLPELGVEDMRQETFAGLVLAKLPGKTPMAVIDEPDGTDMEAGIFKGSMAFKELLDGYIKTLEDDYVPKVDFVLGGQTLLTYDQVKQMFRRDCKYLPLMKRIKEIEKRVKKRGRNARDLLLQSNYDECDRRIERARMSGELTPVLAKQIYDERDAFAGSLDGKIDADVRNYLKHWYVSGTLEVYFNLITNESLMEELLSKGDAGSGGELREHLAAVARQGRRLKEMGKITEDDLAGFVYLDSIIQGRPESSSYDLVIVDEGQDLSEFQYYILRMIARSGSFTIAGDLNQGIHEKGLKSWDCLSKAVFGDLPVKYMTLKKSYRSTVEIMRLANEIIAQMGGDAELAEPVLRHNHEPELELTGDTSETVRSMADKVMELIDEGYQTFGIVCKDADEAKYVHKMLNAQLKSAKHGNKAQANLLVNNQTDYKGGISVISAPLCKGLEFDVTVICDAARYSLDPHEIRLFYVAATRALHRLVIYSVGVPEVLKKTSLISEAAAR